jgi:hypothetical protein
MVNRLGEQNLAYVMLVLLEGLSGALFFHLELTLIELTLIFAIFYCYYHFHDAPYLSN